MHVNLEEEKQNFTRKKKEEISFASWRVALQLLLGISYPSELFFKKKEKKNLLQRLERAIRAERIKGLQKHWSYDLNRHIALKQVRDKLLTLHEHEHEHEQ